MKPLVIMLSNFLLLNLLPLAIAAPAKRAEPAPLHIPQGDVIPNKYIVKLKETFSISSADNILRAHNAEAEKVYSHIFHGFAGPLNASAVEQLRHHPEVRLRP
jgi:hypothetical protein